MDVALNPDSDTSWLCHLPRVASPLWAGVSCLDHVGVLTYPLEKSERFCPHTVCSPDPQ